MKETKLALAAAVLIGGLVAYNTSALAQETNNSAPGAAEGGKGAHLRQHFQRITAELNLTDTQKEQLRPVLKNQVRELKSVRQDLSLTRAQKLEKFKEIRLELTAKVKTILTPGQFEKWQQIRAEMRNNRRQSNQSPPSTL